MKLWASCRGDEEMGGGAATELGAGERGSVNMVRTQGPLDLSPVLVMERSFPLEECTASLGLLSAPRKKKGSQ